MKVRWTETARTDLDNILAFSAERYPSLVNALELRIRAVVSRIGRWPESARQVEQRTNVRVVPLVRFPYRIFYQIADGQIEVLHIHHAAQDEPPP